MLLSNGLLDRPSKHVESDHVPREMPGTCVEKLKSEQLPEVTMFQVIGAQDEISQHRKSAVGRVDFLKDEDRQGRDQNEDGGGDAPAGRVIRLAHSIWRAQAGWKSAHRALRQPQALVAHAVRHLHGPKTFPCWQNNFDITGGCYFNGGRISIPRARNWKGSDPVPGSTTRVRMPGRSLPIASWPAEPTVSRAVESASVSVAEVCATAARSAREAGSPVRGSSTWP